MLKLFHNDMSVCAQKVRMLLCAKKLEWESEHLDIRGGDQHKPEFRALNPKGLIPVLVHDDKVILESNVIVEYLEDVFPQHPMMPTAADQRAQVRWWMVQLDAGLHVHVATISFCLAFRYQVMERCPTDAAMAEFINNIPDPERRAFMEDTLPNGTQSTRLKFAVAAYSKLLNDMSKALKDGGFLVGNTMSAADIAYIPYIDRLEQLGLSEWWSDKPEIKSWAENIRSDGAYKEGIEKWKNPKYIETMTALSQENWQAVKSLIE
jgi:glutathione S-transferase